MGIAPYAWDSGVLGAAELDADGRMVRVNHRLRQASPAQLVGSRFTDLVEPHQREAVAARLADPPTDWEAMTVAFLELTEPMATDRRLWLRRADTGGTLVVVEQALGDPQQVSTELLRLTDDLLAEHRELGREREQLRHAREEALARAERLRGLDAVSTAGLSAAGLDEVLHDLLRAIVRVVGSERATVLLREGDTLVVRAAVGRDDEVRARVRVPVGRGVSGTIAATGRPRLIDDLSTVDVVSPLLRRRGSLAGVPLRLGREIIGVLHVDADETARFGEETLQLLGPVADRAAVAIARAQVYEREHRIAEVLQRALLPERLPAVEGLGIAARFRAGGEGVAIGGDWYDAIPLSDGRVALAVGDVAGKGITAASLMGSFRHSLQAFAMGGDDPRDVLARLDQVARRNDALATVALVHLTPATGAVLHARAGHLPPLLVGADGEPRFLHEGRSGPLLAFRSEFEPGRFELEPGAVVVLYSDGLIEQRGTAIDDRLELLLETARGGAPNVESLADRLLDAMLGPHDAPDDVTLLAVERLDGDRAAGAARTPGA